MRLLCLVALILLYSKAALVSSFTTTVLPSIKEGSSNSSNGTQTIAESTTEKPNQNCYVCYSCSRVETSQSLPCPKGNDKCIVIELITGQFDRNCSDDEKCESERKNRVNKNVHCCSDDNCNGQNSLFPPAMVSIMMVVAISNVISSF